MSEPAIEVEDAGKRFTKYDDAPLLVSSLARLRTRNRRSKLWALRGADFEISSGECVGVVGRNGSGKSTLLQMLAGVTAPTEGRVRVRGRVAPLISVGVGFHPELTGRENVYVNGTILGLSRNDIETRFDEIVAFSEIGDFIDTPVKFYSSGMFVRLGFSVSVMADPDVLLVDEVLAVGDLAFQVKCFERMEELRRRGTTIVVVTHNLNAVRRMCDRTIVIHDGLVRHDGDTSESLSVYHELLAQPRHAATGPATASAGSAELTDVELLGPDEQPSRHFGGGDTFALSARLRFRSRCQDPLLGITVLSEGGVHVYGENWTLDREGGFDDGDELKILARFDNELATGSYSAQIGLMSQGLDHLSAPVTPLLFYVSGRARVRGVADLDGRLSVEETSP